MLCQHGQQLNKSLLMSSGEIISTTNVGVVAPLFKTSPTHYRTLYTILQLTQGINAHVVGPDKRTVISLDLDLYFRAVQIQQSVGNTNWFLQPGGLHIAFALLHALGKTVDASGIDTCSIETGSYTSASLRRIYNGKHYKRGVDYHITAGLSILMMMYDSILSDENVTTITEDCSSFKQSLHNRAPEMNTNYDKVENWYNENVKPHELKDFTDMSRFLVQYLQQVDCLLQLISACRSGDFLGYVAALEDNINYFFAHDLLNYARLMPVHLAQLKSLKHEDPLTWQAFKDGEFVCSKSEVPFTRLYTDQALEQENKILKGHGGMVGLSQDEKALDRLLVITPHVARMVKSYLSTFSSSLPGTNKRREHYQLSGQVAVRCSERTIMLRQSIERHCEGNPFKIHCPLKNLASSAIIPETANNNILQFASKGKACFEHFVTERLLQTSQSSV